MITCWLFIACNNDDTAEPIASTPIIETAPPIPTISASPDYPTPAVLPETKREDYKYKLRIEADYREGDSPEFCDTKVEYSEKHERGEGHGIMTLPHNQAPFLDPFTRTFSIKSHGCSSMPGGLYQFSHWELDEVVVESPDGTVTVTVDDNNLERTLVAVFKWKAMN